MGTIDKEKHGPMTLINISKLFEDYLDRWVALDKYEPDYQVIASGDSADEVYHRALKQGIVSPVVFKVSKKLKQTFL
jgi:hypothetical protein